MQYKRVISFGDSFTWGSELSDSIDLTLRQILENPTEYPREHNLLQLRDIGPDKPNTIQSHGYSRSTWPALIANYLGAEYVCYGKPGSSNHTIARHVISKINSFERDDLVIINWTYSSRWDYVIENFNDEWTTARPGSDDYKSQLYFKEFSHEVSDKWESLRNMLMISQLLNSMKITYLTSIGDPITFDQTWHTDDCISNAQALVKNSSLITFNNVGFNEWAEDYPRGPNGHPLEEAHRAAFEYIIEHHDFTK